MFRYLFVIFLFSIQSLLANWDQYAGERLVLFSLAPGTGEQFPESYQEQLVPTYFRKIASQYPEIKAKIIAIDPSLSQDPAAKQYAFLFLEGWENEGMTFRKENIEIQFFSEFIPSQSEFLLQQDYTQRVESYLSKVLENKGCAFIGHHGQAYYAFTPFRAAYNKLKCDSIQMYICCADWPPFSNPKVYGNHLCHQEELDDFYDYIMEYWIEFLLLESAGDKEVCYQFLQSITQEMNLNFKLYRDLTEIPYEVIYSSNQLQILLKSIL